MTIFSTTAYKNKTLIHKTANTPKRVPNCTPAVLRHHPTLLMRCQDYNLTEKI